MVLAPQALARFGELETLIYGLCLGGLGTRFGPVIGAIVVVLAPQALARFAERVYGVLDHPNTEVNSGSFQPPKMRGEIVFRDVSFGYSPEKKVLKHLNLDVRAGSTVAIVGPTGAGKSSIISLLNRQYEVSSGKILIDGTDIRDYDLDYLRRHIGLVLQDVFLLFRGAWRNYG